MRKGLLLCVTLCIFSTSHSRAQAQERQRTVASQPSSRESQLPAELFVKLDFSSPESVLRKRVNSHLGSNYTDIAHREFKARKGTSLNAAEFFGGILDFACVFNAWWKEDAFQEATFEEYMKRVPLVPEGAERDWAAAIAESNPPGLQVLYNIGAIIVQDRLFDANGFRPAESEKLLKRLRSIPRQAITQWAEVRRLDRWQAAISLVQIDSLFREDLLQEARFAEILSHLPQS